MPNPYASRAKIVVVKTEVPITKEPLVASTVSEAGVPDGTISEVKSWVGDDTVRARTALDEENAKSDPRVTLVAYLEGLLEDESE